MAGRGGQQATHNFASRSFTPRSHSRSASWSHTNGTSGIDLLSPIRVFQEFVPSFTSSHPPRSSAGRMVDSHVASLASRNSTRHRNGDGNGIYSRQSSVIDIEASDNSGNASYSGNRQSSNTNGRNNGDRVEFYGAITWAEKTFPFLLILLSRIMWDHRLGILVFIGLFGTFIHANSTIKRQVALRERRLNRISLWTFIFLFGNICFIYYVFYRQKLQKCLIFQKPNFLRLDVWTVFWCVGITDFVIRFATMAIKSMVIVIPRRLIPFRKRGKYFLLLEHLSQMYRTLTPIPQWYFYFTDYNVGGEYFAMVSTGGYLLLKARMMLTKLKELVASCKSFRRDTRYGNPPSKAQILEAGNACPICQEELSNPIALASCNHIFCEDCISMWFDRERTCPMCRASIAGDPLWRDGSTSAQLQVF